VGKHLLLEKVSSSSQRKTTNMFNAQLTLQKINVENMEANVVLYEIHEKQGYKKLHPLYIQGSDGVIIVADATKPSTIQHMMDWAASVRHTANDIPIVFVANKADEVTPSTFIFIQEQLAKTAEIYDSEYFMVSARMEKGIDAPFRTLLEQIKEYRNLIEEYANSGLKREKIKSVIKERIRSEINEIEREIKSISQKSASPDKLFILGKKISEAERKACALLDTPSKIQLRKLKKELEEACSRS